MSGNIIQLNEDLIKNNLKDLVRNSVEETLNALLDHEADELALASMSERETVRATVPVITSGILARLPAKSDYACRSSRASSLRRPSSSAINAVNALSRKPLLRCTWPAYPCAVSKISPNCFGAQRSPLAPSAISTSQMLRTIGQLTLERDFLQDCFRQAGEAIPRIPEYDQKG